jgi:NFU1 iron-sulfur cluster scaffold homolog, mitochondrial
MSFTITEFEPTPNPNAMKCWLDKPISDHPRSFLNAEMAADDPIARDLFEKAGATTVLFNGNWLTVNKQPDASWPTVKRRIAAVLAAANTGETE